MLTGTDLTIEMSSGTAFLAEVPDGPTAVVLLGRGRMRFNPPDAAEQTQIRLFTGADDLVSEFDAAFVRLKPSEFQSKFKAEALVERAVVAADLRRATEVFDEFIVRTLQLDLTDLSRERWSLIPSSGDLIAEVRTRRFGTLTYARSGNEAEDITVFDRRRRRNVSLYASPAKLASRGRYLQRRRPRRLRRPRLRDRCVDHARTLLDQRHGAHEDPRPRRGMTTMTLKLAEQLTVRGVYSPGAGRLLHLRVVNQNNLIVNLPTPAFRDDEFTLSIVYSGRLEPSEMDREAIDLQSAQQQPERELPTIPIEPRYIYSNNSYWYPQSTVSDYALASLRLTIPAEYEVVASGTQAGPPRQNTPTATGQRASGRSCSRTIGRCATCRASSAASIPSRTRS